MNHRQVEQCIETLCEKGCRAVWSDIRALESGQVLPEVRALSSAEVHLVVSELKAIMAVYEDSCVVG